MRGRGAPAVVLAVVALAVAAPFAAAHAGLVRSAPVAGATLGAAPNQVRLTFSEQAEASLSDVRVLGAGGTSFQEGRPAGARGDASTVVVGLRPLGRGVYTVTWRVVSAVDGHATAGAYAFGVGVSPARSRLSAPVATPTTSTLELVARWLFLLGLVMLLGSAVAGAGGFAGPGGADLRFAAAGWLLALGGLLLLAEAQRRNAGASFDTLLGTSVGRALIWRAVCLGLAGAALLGAALMSRHGRAALAATAGAVVAAIAVHVGAGHAAAGSWPSAVTVTAQAAHFAAAGIWLGGLAALLLGVRGAASAEKAAAVRRFSAVAGVALVVVIATGTLRAIDELSAFGQLWSTGYGRAILVKVALFGLLAALGLRNRRRNVPAAATDLGPLRRIARGELVLAVGALATAALLGTLAPPVGGQPTAPEGLVATGRANGVGVRLSTVSPEPGPNTFVARVEGAAPPVLRLRFTPLDDPGVAPTTLVLRRGPQGTYRGAGANLAFDGRWGLTAAAGTTSVPLELDVPGPKLPVTVERLPGQPTHYDIEEGNVGFIRLSVQPARAGRSTLLVSCFDVFQNFTPVSRLVVTTAAGDGPVRRWPVRRLGVGRFAADVDLSPGPVEITVVAHVRPGRMRGVYDLAIPAR